jgi:cytochrome b subunit of formate dehydrogenase
MFYGLFGLLLILLASDVERYRALVRYVGWGSVIAGFLMTFIGLHSGIPTYWSYHEGPSAAAFGVLLLWLIRTVPRKTV